MRISKLEAEILFVLSKAEAVDELSSLKLDDINNYRGEQLCSRSNMIHKIYNLVNAGYIAEGLRDGHAKTYFITDDGKNIIGE